MEMMQGGGMEEAGRKRLFSGCSKMMSGAAPILRSGLTGQFPLGFGGAAQPWTDLQLHVFWAKQLQEVRSSSDFKNHNLPLARIKKIMKADEDVKMIAAETPVLFSRACEMFILELTHRSWAQAEHSKRRTLQRSDVAAAISRTLEFDFLVDIVPVDEEFKEPGMSPDSATANDLGHQPATVPCFYDPSKFGSLMLDSQSLAYIQQHQQQHLMHMMQEKQSCGDKYTD